MLKRTLFYTTLLAALFSGARATSVTSYKSDVTSNFITLYQSGAANINEERSIKGLKNGINTVFLADLLNQYDENLVVDVKGLSALNIPQNDLASDSLLKRFEGTKVGFLPKEKGVLTKLREGKLLKVLGDDRFVIEFNGGVEVGVEGALVLKPEDFTRGMPNFSINSTSNIETVGLNYNANNLSWRPVYRFFADEKGAGDFMAEALIQNNLEQDIKNAIITLASGSGIMSEPITQPRQMKAFAFASPAEDSMITMQAYDVLNKWAMQIPGVVNLQAGMVGKFQILQGVQVMGARMMAFESYVGKYPVQNRDIPFKPIDYIKFANNTGMGLPNGSIKVYDAKTKKFVAEDRLPDTAVGQDIKIRLGEAFDVNISRLQKSFMANEAKEYTMEFEITVSNLSSIRKSVSIIENFDGQFDIKKSNKKYAIRGQAAEWQLSVAPNSLETLSYQVVLK